MDNVTFATRRQLGREIAHWQLAAARLGRLDDLASAEAWEGLERYLGVAIRQRLLESIARLRLATVEMQALFTASNTEFAFRQVERMLQHTRGLYLRTETLMDFFSDAINTRTNRTVAGLLRACDALARRSMTPVLRHIERPIPLVLTYLDGGLGASILKAGLRLWDGSTENPVAAIKVTRHNLFRPTSLIHEAGHQVAHQAHWNEELAAALEVELQVVSPEVASLWAGWASEIAADAFAFAHTGFASVSALHDVLAGEPELVFQHLEGGPHPTGYLRLRLGTAMCRQWYGAGPWDELEAVWTQRYPLDEAAGPHRRLLQAAAPAIDRVAAVSLKRPYRAFRGVSLAALVDPNRVSPAALSRLEQEAGAALFTSPHWIARESLRLLALSGLQSATSRVDPLDILKRQEAWMTQLGDVSQLALV